MAMQTLKRLVGISLLLGIVVGAASMQLGTRSASAQAASATLTCNGTTCTITLVTNIQPGGSFTVTLPNGAQATTTCPNGCTAGSQFVVNMNGAVTTQAAVVTPSTAVVATSSVAIPTGGLCVNGSYPGPFGCTSPTVGAFPPYYQQPYIQPYYPSFYGFSGGCLWFFAGCGSNNNLCVTHHHHVWSGSGTWSGTWSGSSTWC